MAFNSAALTFGDGKAVPTDRDASLRSRLKSETAAHQAVHLVLRQGLLLRLGRQGKDQRYCQCEKISVLRNLIATSRGCCGQRKTCVQILPHFSGFQSARCASNGRCYEFRGRSQLWDISLRHSADVAILEHATACPFHYFANRSLLGRGNTSCRCQELVPKLVEPGTAVAIVGRRRRVSFTDAWFGKPVSTRSAGTIPGGPSLTWRV